MDLETKEDLSRVLKCLFGKKLFSLFFKPVDEREVPGYSRVIKQPMDLKTMQTKLTSDQYKNIKQFYNDIILIYDNCLRFNKGNWIIECIANVFFSKAKKELKRMNRENHPHLLLKKLNRILANPPESMQADLPSLSFYQDDDMKPISVEDKKLTIKTLNSATRTESLRKLHCLFEQFNVPSKPTGVTCSIDNKDIPDEVFRYLRSIKNRI